MLRNLDSYLTAFVCLVVMDFRFFFLDLPSSTLIDGLSYPKKFQVVTIHYTAWTESPNGDGTLVEFDSTLKRGKPLTFQLGAEQVIRGLEEGVSQVLFHFFLAFFSSFSSSP